MPPTLARAIERYEFAIARSPNFAKGWASLAEAYDYASVYVGRDRDQDAKRAETAARRAIALDPKLAKGHAMLGLVLFCLRFDFKAAENSYLQRHRTRSPLHLCNHRIRRFIARNR